MLSILYNKNIFLYSINKPTAEYGYCLVDIYKKIAYKIFTYSCELELSPFTNIIRYNKSDFLFLNKEAFYTFTKNEISTPEERPLKNDFLYTANKELLLELINSLYQEYSHCLPLKKFSAKDYLHIMLPGSLFLLFRGKDVFPEDINNSSCVVLSIISDGYINSLAFTDNIDMLDTNETIKNLNVNMAKENLLFKMFRLGDQKTIVDKNIKYFNNSYITSDALDIIRAELSQNSRLNSTDTVYSTNTVSIYDEDLIRF